MTEATAVQGAGHASVLEAWRLNEAGAHEAAERMCRDLIAADSHDADTWCTLGVVQDGMGRRDESIESYRRAIALRPIYPVAHNNLGNTLISARRYAEAGESLRRAIEQKPDYARAYFNLGVLGLAQKQFGAAIASLRKSLELAPMDVRALIALGVALIETGQTDEAKEIYERIVGIDPQQHEACYGLSTSFGHRGDLASSKAWLKRAMELNPGSPHLASTWLCALQYDASLPPAEVYRAHVQWAKRHAPAGGDDVHRFEPGPKGRLRVGYVSPDLRAHPVAYFVGPLLANHDPNRVDIVCYADVSAPDDTTAALKTLAGTWRNIAGLSDEQVGKLIREDEIDILVDLTGHTAHHRLAVFATRAAPVQVSYMGYPGTTGVAAMDYCLVDEVTAPPGEDAYFSERLVRLPHGFSCYAGAADAPDPGPLPAFGAGMVTFGSLHKPIKINARVIDLWASVLDAVPSSRLLMVRKEMTAWVQNNLKREFSRRGIASRRLVFGNRLAKPYGHLMVYGDIDVSLDTIPWNGHATACDSLWMGVPMVTLRGDRHAGRMTASVLSQLGLHQLIAGNASEFRECAVALASDLPLLAELRASLRERMRASHVARGDRFTAALEDSYDEMWRRACAERAG